MNKDDDIKELKGANTTTTFLANDTLLAKTKFIAKQEEVMLKDVLNKSLHHFITAYESKKGTIPYEAYHIFFAFARKKTNARFDDLW